MQVLVTGAGGGVGAGIMDQLREIGVSVCAASRQPDARRWPWARTVAGDLTRPVTMRDALRGVDAVFLYSFAESQALPELAAEMANAGVTKVVVLSTIDTTRNEPFVEYNKRRHLAVEKTMADAGFTVVCLRPGAFSRNAIRFWARQIREHRNVGLPFPDSQQAPIADDDIAAVAVRALTSTHLDGRKLVLTGPQSLSMRQQVSLISDAIGEPIDITVLTDAQARSRYGQVLPPAYLDLLMAQWKFEVSEPAVVTTTVHEVTGHPPMAFRDWAMRHRVVFA